MTAEHEVTQEVVTPVEEASILVSLSQNLFSKLSHKNQQFMLSLDKQLFNSKLVGDTKKAVYTELAETLIEGQHNGITARQLYGTPTEAAVTILNQKFPTDASNTAKSPDAHLYLDGALLLGSVFAIISGLSTESSSTGISGLVAIILNYIMAGFVMLVAAKYQPNPNAPKGQKGWVKYFGFTMLSMIAWYVVIILAQLLPKSINRPLSSELYLLIGFSTIALRFYLKKKLNIRGSIF